jgi:cyclic pyranopterin phosphate synthase
VLEGIAAAQAAGLGQDAQGHWRHLKINMVVKRDTNLNQVVPMAQYFRGKGLSLRFIEYMDVGATNGWCLDEVVPSQELLAMLQAVHPLVALPPSASGETAQRWGWADAHGRHDPALGEIGFISSVTQAFCHECNRARLSTEGKLYLCLFASQGYDLKTLLRQTTPPVTDAQLASAIGHIWQGREDRYSALRAQMPPASRTAGKRIEMSYIGG